MSMMSKFKVRDTFHKFKKHIVVHSKFEEQKSKYTSDIIPRRQSKSTVLSGP